MEINSTIIYSSGCQNYANIFHQVHGEIKIWMTGVTEIREEGVSRHGIILIGTFHNKVFCMFG